jgi:hypothetical protein
MSISKVGIYKVKKKDRLLSEDWASMIGKRYGAGWASGTGHVSDVKLKGIELSFLETDTSCGKVYHLAPKGLLPFIEESTKSMFSEILKMALELQKEDLKLAAISALEENKKIINHLNELESGT